MTRILVQVRQTPTILPGVPLPPKSRGRQPKPINPVFAAMKPGEAIIVSGKSDVSALRNDLTRYLKSLGENTPAKFVTRNLSGVSGNGGANTPYPDDTMGLWCLVAHCEPTNLSEPDGASNTDDVPF